MPILGIIFALVTLVSWGFGDFFIQRTSRRTGIIHAIFYVTITASVVLLPFVWSDIWQLPINLILLLLASGVALFFIAALQFKVLTVGKLAIVEPIVSLELPITILLLALFSRENLHLTEYLVIAVVFVGILLTVTPHKHIIARYLQTFERGTWLALAGAFGMAINNLVIANASHHTSPLVAIWATHTVIAVMCLIYFLFTNQFHTLAKDFRKSSFAILAESFFDNIAWISYAFAVIYISTSVAVTISEGYIILAVLLGVLVNRERLKHHQYLGVILAIAGVLVLSYISS